eukprot:756886-Hanusia_phi.AAC.2
MKVRESCPTVRLREPPIRSTAVSAPAAVTRSLHGYSGHAAAALYRRRYGDSARPSPATGHDPIGMTVHCQAESDHSTELQALSR